MDRGGVRVLDKVSFTAGPGCLMGVVGPNGAGKSTLFNVIVSQLPATAGRVLVHGKSIAETRGLVAYVPQQERMKLAAAPDFLGRGDAGESAADWLVSAARTRRPHRRRGRAAPGGYVGAAKFPGGRTVGADSGSGCSSLAPWLREPIFCCWTRLSAGWTYHRRK